ncbi:substrate-binding domain-containing protein [Fontivita pretiosa]|uniref:substrate-binding domain-containing protein n=1 Tax=Fontivita pretiosa TaxID=2989684 RepID=UPI003D169F1A
MTTQSDHPVPAPNPAAPPASGSTKVHHSHRLLYTIIAILVLANGVLMWNLGSFRPRPKIAIVTSGEGPYWDTVISGAQEAARVYDVDLTVIKTRTDVEAQTQAIRSLLGKGYKGVGVSPISPIGQAGILAELANETTLVTFDSDSPVSRRLCFVGTDNYTAGRIAGEQVHRAIPEGGEVAIVIGNLDKENTQRRRQGVIDELLERPFNPDQAMDPPDQIIRGEKYTILPTIVDHSDPATATAMAIEAINQHPNLKCFVGMLSYSTPAILKALQTTGKLGQIKVVGFDVNDQTLEGIEAGHVFATIMQDQFGCGYHTVRLLAETARGDRSGLPTFQRRTLPVEVINRDNVDTIRALVHEEGIMPAPSPATQPAAGAG